MYNTSVATAGKMHRGDVWGFDEGLKGFSLHRLGRYEVLTNCCDDIKKLQSPVFKRDLIWLKGILLECLFSSQLLPERFCSSVS